MGRPRKNPLPAVKTEQEKALDALVAESQRLGLYDESAISEALKEESKGYKLIPKEVPKPVECNNLALSILRNPVNQRWMLVSIKFDYKTKTYGEMTVVEEHTDRIEIVHRYQVISGTEFMSTI